MFLTLLSDFILALSFWCGPPMDHPLADAYYPCYSEACHCPKDSPCKAGCSRDACCCQATACGGYAASCSPNPTVIHIPAPAPVTPDYALAVPRFYEVQLKLDKHNWLSMALAGGEPGVVEIPHPAYKDRVCRLMVHLKPAGKDSVKMALGLHQLGQNWRPYPKMTLFKGMKEVYFETPTNVVLSGDEPEPYNAQVFVKAVDAPMLGAMAMPCPACPPGLPCAACPPYASYPANPPYQPQQWAVPTMPPQVAYVPVAPPLPPMPAPPSAAYVFPPLPPMPPMHAPPRIAYPPSVATLPEPLPLPAQPVPPPAPYIERCTATVSANAACTSTLVGLVRCCNKSTLAMKSDGLSTTSVRMTIDKGEVGPLTVSAGKKYVHVSGKKWKAQAEQVEICADGRVILSGHVKLLSDKIGVCASVKAEKLCVQVKQGKFQAIVNH